MTTLTERVTTVASKGHTFSPLFFFTCDLLATYPGTLLRLSWYFVAIQLLLCCDLAATLLRLSCNLLLVCNLRLGLGFGLG